MKPLIALLICFCLIPFSSQCQILGYAKQLGGSSDDEPRSIAVDAAGNQYITGKFVGTADFDPGPGVLNLTSVGAEDIFVCKLNSSGNLVWANQIGSSGIDFGKSLAIDGSGNTYITGIFSATVNFDPGGVTNLTSLGSTDTYICKLDADGKLIWVKQIGGLYDDNGTSITVDASKNVYTTGSFKGTVDFDPGAGAFNLTSTGNSDVFVSKLDADGNFVWARSMGGGWNDEANCIKVDAQSNVYTVGKFGSDADFDPGSASYVLHGYSQLGLDAFISKLDASGSFVWAKQFSEPWSNGEFVYANSLALDVSGNVYVAGNYQGHFDMDTGPGVMYLSSYGNDSYVVKLNSSGELIWGKEINRGCQNSTANSIAVDESGNIYATGYFSFQGDFDPGTNVYEMQSYGGNDVYISKLNPSGDLIWAADLGSTWNYDFGYSIALDGQANIYSTGCFADVANFYPEMYHAPGGNFYFARGTYNLTTNGGLDIYIHKISQGSVILPLQWANFIVQKNGAAAELKWTTLDEQNVRQFIIQNSTDAIHWNNISTINAHNNKSKNEYNYTHTSPMGGTSFYRVQLRQLSGQISYSEIKSIKFNEGKIKFTVLINPINNGVMTVKIHSATTLSLFDNTGQLLWRKNKDAGIEVIDMNKFPKGIYFLRSPEQYTKVLLQ